MATHRTPSKSSPPETESVFAGRYAMLEPVPGVGDGSLRRAWDRHRGAYVAARLLPMNEATTLLRLARHPALQITHPGVAAPRDWAVAGDTAMIVTDLLYGGSLAQLLADRRSLDVSYTAELVSQLLDALIAIHAVRVIHRRVEPKHVMLEATRRGTPKLRLAGLRHAALPGREETATIAPSEYSAPELSAGAAPDPRQDIYAVGLIAAVALTGGHPANIPDLLHRTSTAERADAPAAIWHVLHTFVATEPNQRPVDAVRAARLWSAALHEAEISPVNTAATGAVEVFARMAEPPAHAAVEPEPGPPATPHERATEPAPVPAKPRDRALWAALSVTVLGATLTAVSIVALLTGY